MRILCAVCNKEVDFTQWYRDIPNNVTRVVAHCHGAVDDCAVTDQFVVEAGPEFAANPEGVAFADQHTTPEKPVRALAHVR